MSLDEQIVAAANLLAVLLVFVFAYFSALLPQIEELRSRQRPDVKLDRTQLSTRLRTYQLITVGLAVLVLAIFLLLVPLARQVIDAGFLTPFDTLRAALLLVQMLLVVTVIVLASEWILLRKRRGQLS